MALPILFNYRSMKMLRTLTAFAVLILSSCIGTDMVEDQIAQISITVPPDVPFVNNVVSKVEGQELNLTITALNDRGHSFATEGIWFSADERIVRVDDTGKAIAVGSGSTTLTASALGVQSDPIRFTVVSDDVSIALSEITADTSVVAINGQLQLMATALTATGSEITEAEIGWRSLNEGLATVNTEGLVTGISQGVVDIEASSDNIIATFQITVGGAQSRGGQFEPLNGYNTSGGVSVVMGAEVLRVDLADNFRSSNGPGLYVYLSNSRTAVSGGIELGKLTSTSGASSYATPSGIGIDDFNYVIIYCKPFGAGFGTALLD